MVSLHIHSLHASNTDDLFALKYNIKIELTDVADSWKQGNLILRKQSTCGPTWSTGGKNMVLIQLWRWVIRFEKYNQLILVDPVLFDQLYCFFEIVVHAILLWFPVFLFRILNSVSWMKSCSAIHMAIMVWIRKEDLFILRG